MLKQILVPATGTAQDAAAFSSALALAKAFSAHLTFLHVRPDPEAAVMAAVGFDGGSAAAGLYEAVESGGAEGEARARAGFETFRRAEHLPEGGTEFLVGTGDEAAMLAEHGRTADLLVTGRRRAGEAVAMGLLQTLLLSTGRPLLLVPDQPMPVPETVAIAWKSTPEAARSVAFALPFVLRASRVVVLSVEEASSRPEGAGSGERLAATLRRHNPNATYRALPSDSWPADAMLNATAELGAGLLVMGGYGHGRTREFVFGGFTRQILMGAPLPVLMAH